MNPVSEIHGFLSISQDKEFRMKKIYYFSNNLFSIYILFWKSETPCEHLSPALDPTLRYKKWAQHEQEERAISKNPWPVPGDAHRGSLG